MIQGESEASKTETTVFYSLISRVTFDHFCHVFIVVVIRRKSVNSTHTHGVQGHKGVNIKRERSLKVILGDPYHA